MAADDLAEGTVIVWDQRRALHTATLDSLQGKRRHMVRLMSLAGKPIPAGADK
jgi:sulfonate dioxygenase